ncbi:MAG: transposase [Tissierellales bacterium]|nr:transposase [Tissierellales bacterium]
MNVFVALLQPHQRFFDQEHAKLTLFRWIETWYNKRRRHSALGYKTINEFEQLNNNQRIAA